LTRTFADNRCPDCKQHPKHNLDGKLTCICKGKVWGGVRGVPGTEPERAMLASKGFVQAQDKDGDVYYVGPGNRIIWVFPNGTWTGDKPSENDPSLAAYLKEIPDDSA
jgi:hypothetical protein